MRGVCRPSTQLPTGGLKRPPNFLVLPYNMKGREGCSPRGWARVEDRFGKAFLPVGSLPVGASPPSPSGDFGTVSPREPARVFPATRAVREMPRLHGFEIGTWPILHVFRRFLPGMPSGRGAGPHPSAQGPPGQQVPRGEDSAGIPPGRRREHHLPHVPLRPRPLPLERQDLRRANACECRCGGGVPAFLKALS